MTIDTNEVDSALLDLEGTSTRSNSSDSRASASRGREFHALAELSRVAVQKAAELRLAIFPEASGGHDGEAAR